MCNVHEEKNVFKVFIHNLPAFVRTTGKKRELRVDGDMMEKGFWQIRVFSSKHRCLEIAGS